MNFSCFINKNYRTANKERQTGEITLSKVSMESSLALISVFSCIRKWVNCCTAGQNDSPVLRGRGSDTTD